MIRPLNYPTVVRSESIAVAPNNSASNASVSSTAQSVAASKAAAWALAIKYGKSFLFVGFGVSLISGLIGSVALEGARRENLGFSGRAQAALGAVETLKLDVEQLRRPGVIEDWAKLNGFVRVESSLPVASASSSAAPDLSGTSQHQVELAQNVRD